jgi:DNA-binding transcriptional LysR family regulator
MLNLKFEQVRAFLHASRGGGNTNAANALHLTQPAITARIKNLELLLGTELFDRDDGARRLSKRGELMLEYADQLEHLVNQIERNVADPAGIEGYLRIGVSETIAQYWMSTLIKELHATFPKIQIELQVDISPRLHDALCGREIDLIIALGTSPDQQVKLLPLPPVTLNWYTSSKDPVQDASAARALFNKPVITYPRKTRPYQEMRDAVWQKLGRDVSLLPSSSLPSSMRLVAAGVGVAAFPAFLTTEEERNGTICRFDPQWCPHPLNFGVHYINDPSDPMVERVAKIASRIAVEHVGPDAKPH